MIKLLQLLTTSIILLMSFALAAAQTCKTEIISSTPTGDFTSHSDGTVTHIKTGLMWQVCSQGQTWDNGSCTGVGTAHNWQDALLIPSTLNVSGGYAGYSDWRLPDYKELNSIFEVSCYNPSINSIVFPSTPSNVYWTSSPRVYDSELTWYINFEGALTFLSRRYQTLRVRLVRGG